MCFISVFEVFEAMLRAVAAHQDVPLSLPRRYWDFDTAEKHWKNPMVLFKNEVGIRAASVLETKKKLRKERTIAFFQCFRMAWKFWARKTAHQDLNWAWRGAQGIFTPLRNTEKNHRFFKKTYILTRPLAKIHAYMKKYTLTWKHTRFHYNIHLHENIHAYVKKYTLT